MTPKPTSLLLSATGLIAVICLVLWFFRSSDRGVPATASPTDPKSAHGQDSVQVPSTRRSGLTGQSVSPSEKAVDGSERPTSAQVRRRSTGTVPTARFRQVTVFGRVTVSGNGVESYRIRFLRTPAPKNSRKPVWATTGARGEYELKLEAPAVYRANLLPPGSEASLLLTRLPLDGLRDRVERDFRVGATARLRLLVVRADGRTARQQPLTVARRSVSGWSSSRSSTGADGLADLELSPGDYVISSWNPKDGQFGKLNISLAADESLSATLKLGRAPAKIHGTVLDARTGSGVPEARITLLRSGQTHPDTAFPTEQTNAGIDGRFAIPVTEEGEHYLAIRANGYLEGHSDLFAVTRGTPLPELSILLEPGFDLNGAVTDALGNAAPGAEVRLRFSRPDAGLTEVSTVTDELGGFLFQGIPQGRSRVSATLGGYSSEAVEVALPETSFVPLQLRTAQGRIEGRAVWSDGKAVSQPFTVLLIKQTVPFTIDNLHPFPDSLQDPNGRFALEGIQPGTYVVQVTARPPDTNSTERRSGQSPPFEIPQEGGTVQIRVVLEP